MQALNFDPLIAAISDIPKSARDGSLNEIKSNTVLVRGISKVARIGDLVTIYPRNGKPIFGEVIVLHGEQVEVLSENGTSGLGLNDRVRHLGTSSVRPDKSWLGRLLDPFLEPLDGEPLLQGKTEFELRASPPPAVERNRLGERLETGLVVLDAMLPLVRGQRLGLFAGSGVGKSTLLADIAKGTEADVAVIVLVGERGREVREFVEDTLGSEGLAKSVVIAATSDQSPTARRRAAWAGLAVAEYFRDQAQHVLLLMDSLTRFAEAHREIATSCGEAASLRGFPPSTTQAITSLCERAGPGPEGKGDITAVFSVLVAGSDFDEPVADITRGVLDGHILLAREIAERGRFPAIDVLKSVSRSLPKAASDDENALIAETKRAMSKYEESEALVQSGLYKPGSDPELDRALLMRPKLEVLFSKKEIRPISEGYELMSTILQSTSE